MSKRILLPIILVLIIIGVIAVNVPSKIDSKKLKADEVTSMKFFVSKEREENYHQVPKHIENESINEIVDALNTENLEVNKDIGEVNNSSRRLYMFLNNKDVIVINKNESNNNEYIIKFKKESILNKIPEDKYVLIKSEKLNGIFEKFENTFNTPEGINTKMSV
ncbi:hypothetical protein [Clostridium sp. B9]|uniref:hypothetical protein n=1 Tax=Clostridium sp. B9 TaxID=3423224 RepID=UPI003D2EAA82